MCYIPFRWGPFVHSLGILKWNSTRRDHPGNPGGVSGSGPVSTSSGRGVTGRETSLAYKRESLQPLREGEIFWDNESLIGGPHLSIGFYLF